MRHINTGQLLKTLTVLTATVISCISVYTVIGQNPNHTQGNSSASIPFKQSGPVNLNGRARAFLIDNQNPEVFYLGIVNGGILKSNNKGISWQRLNTPRDLWISDLTQSPDGTIFAVTNSNFDNTYPLRGGVYKSTDGSSFTPTVTQPLETENSMHINFIRAESKDIIYAGTARQLVVSQDGGESWTETFNTPDCYKSGYINIQDMLLLPGGSALMSSGSTIYHSDNPSTPCSWNEVLNAPGTSRRIVLDYCKNDPDYIYAAVYAQGFVTPVLEIYKSTDGGHSWQLNQPTLSSSPFSAYSLTGFMGVYSLSITTDPINCNLIYVGGQAVYKVGNNWSRLASGYRQIPNGNNTLQTAFQLEFDKENQNKLYVPGENGLFYVDDVTAPEPNVVSLNAGTIGADIHTIDVDARGRIGASTNSKGVLLIDPNKPANAARTAAGLLDIDGYAVKFSNLSNAVYISHSNNRVFRAKENQGNQSFFPFIDQNDYTFAGDNKALDHTTFDYWESAHDTGSIDSLTFKLDTVIQNLQVLQQHTNAISGTIITQPLNAGLIPGTVTFTNASQNQTFVYKDFNQNGELYDDNLNKVGTINYQTKQYEINFNHTPDNNSLLVVKYPYSLNAGDTLFLNSPSEGLPVEFRLTTNLLPGDSIKIQDPYTSLFAMTYNDGIVLSKELLRKGVPEYPEDYIDLKDLQNIQGYPRSVHISNDGNHLYYISGSGIYRISGLKQISTRNANQMNDILVHETIGRWAGINSLKLHPSNNNKMLARVGSDRLFEITGILPGENATSKILSDKLPDEIQQITSMSYDVNNPNTILLGTYEGLYITENANRREPDWILNGGETDLMFIEDIVQVTHKSAEENVYGNFYLATRGRGIWTTGYLGTFVPEHGGEHNIVNGQTKGLRIFPNPANHTLNLTLPEGVKEFEGNMRIFDISGRLVHETRNLHLMTKQPASISILHLNPGTYIVKAQNNNSTYTNRVVISR